MKRVFIYGMGLLIITSFCLSIVIAQPQKMILNNIKVFEKKERPPVLFPHELHMEGDLSCTDCHHKYENGKNILDEDELEEGNSKIKCSNCHADFGVIAINLRDAFHQQCMSCHRKKKEGKKTGPILCGQCHPWK